MPDLHLRVRTARRDHDVVAAVEPTHTVGELAAALATHLAEQLATVVGTLRIAGRRLDPSTPAGQSGLVDGDVVELVTPCSDDDPSSAGLVDPSSTSGVAVDVVAGPDAGHWVLLTRPGRHLVGRAADADVRIDDPTTSRRHLVVLIDETGSAAVEPCAGAANGVQVDGDEVVGRSPIAPSSVVTLGSTRITVRPVAASGTDGRRSFGRVDVHRTPYRPPVVRQRSPAPIGPIPERPAHRRVQVVGVMAPLVAGVAMYAFTRQVTFLALTLMSPIAIVGSALEDRRSGRRSARRRVAAFRDELAVRRAELLRLRDDERRERLASAPDLADLVRRAQRRSIDVWARGREAPDFLTLRLGLGPDTVRFVVTVEPGGDDELRAEAVAAIDGLDRLDAVPVTVDLVADPVLAVHGPARVVAGVVSSLVLQAATLHSPDDLVVAAVVGDRSPTWLHWLPHARSVTSPLAGGHVAREPESADALVDRLLELAVRRVAAGAPPWPRLLVVLDAGAGLDPARVAQLLDLAADAGVSVVWAAPDDGAVPRQAGRTLAVWSSSTGVVRGRLWSTDPDTVDRELEVEHVRADVADRTALALAPLHDASSASLASVIPRTVPLIDVLGVGRPSASWVIEHWEHGPLHESSRGLRFPIGVGADGPIELDLVADGPHTLVGGTSGSGKSELLQSMVAALAVHHPPTRLNFLFVDYKGGASTRVFDRLPHTVGTVTDLSPELAMRALVSLRAELHRRMAVLDGRAKDLAGLAAVAPDEVPASLVIVVDEFATLVREVPDFVAGIVDVAQRGRSLGIHLVLATQRPTGSVDENILANTNLRIALRMLDRAESSAIVDAPDAADIPLPLRGRGVLRLGRRLVEFQSPYGGAPMVATRVRPAVQVVPFDGTDASPGAVSPVGAAATDQTQLDAVLDAVVAADRRLGLPPAHRPWRPVLPDVVALADVVAAAADDDRPRRHPGRFVVIGLLDVPERQLQIPAVVDLEEGGGLLVFGSGGAGASTLLRTIAASIGGTVDAPDRVLVVAFDVSGRGLGGLSDLPHVAAVVAGDDLEAVTRQLLLLEAELARRRAGSTGDDAESLPRIVVLVDGFGALVDLLEPRQGESRGEGWVDRLVRLVVDGRRVGIHVVITADRRASVPAQIHAAVAARLVLRVADDAAALDHGVPAAQVRGVVPGRGILRGSGLVQVASTTPSDLVAVARAPSRCAMTLAGVALPDRLATVDPAPDGGLVVGVADVTGAPVVLDLDVGHLMVCGPPRSGRSTALAAVVSALTRHDADAELVVLGPSRSPLRRMVGPSIRAAFGADAAGLLEQLAIDAADEETSAPIRRVVVVDDADLLESRHDPVLAAAVERLDHDPSTTFVVAIDLRAATGFTAEPLVQLARRSRQVLVMRPDDPVELLQAFGTRFTLRPGLRMPPGRGVLLVDRHPTVVQVVDALGEASPDPPSVDALGRASPQRRRRDRTITPHRYSRVDVP